jgi:hypothetical protein
MSFASKKKKGNKNLTGDTYMNLAQGTPRNLSEKLAKYDSSSKLRLIIYSSPLT